MTTRPYFLGARVLGSVLLALLFCPLSSPAKPVLATHKEMSDAFRKSAPSNLEDLQAIERQIGEVYERVAPAVVAVRVGSSAGSAVIISEDGYALCAAHVGGAPDREVTFIFPDGKRARGRTLGRNLDMDAGLMKITDPGPWPFVEVCDPEYARVGDWVLALGHPGGFDAERSIVARLGRIIRLRGVVQTDCTLIGGDSGGPLFDMQGHVIGIHSRISQSTADNYHVPVGTYLETWERLAKGDSWGGRGPPARSTIGVRAVDSPEGCRLDWVNEGGPAFQAGLRPGDIVLRVNADRISDAEDLVRSIRQIDPGNEATLRIERDGTALSMKVKVESWRGRGGRSLPAP